MGFRTLEPGDLWERAPSCLPSPHPEPRVLGLHAWIVAPLAHRGMTPWRLVSDRECKTIGHDAALSSSSKTWQPAPLQFSF